MSSIIDYDTKVTTDALPAMVESPMLATVTGRPTEYWNDSCAEAELAYAVARGGTGATSNPTTVPSAIAAPSTTDGFIVAVPLALLPEPLT